MRRTPFPSWPVADAREEDALLGVVRSGKWFRGQHVAAFEKAYASLMGATGCLATANGTSALITSLAALGIGPGDEVIVPPYTFVATVNAVLLMHALPVFVDTDLETFQIDARKIEAAMTDRTRAIIPVHLGGAAADLDTILPVAQKRGIPVVEDACQAHLAEWRGRKVGTYGTAGCFSFQASKNLNAGEGGAILTSDDALLERCYRFHNNSRGRRNTGNDFSYHNTGANLRMTEFQAALLVAQMTRLEAQARTRDENAAHLTSLLKAIPGIAPARMYEGCTRNAYHLYMFRYDAGGVLRPPACGVPQGPRRRRRAGLERVLAAEQGAVPGGRARDARLPDDLLEGAARRSGAIRTAVRRTIACARRRSGWVRRCCSDRGRTWRTLPTPYARCRRMLPSSRGKPRPEGGPRPPELKFRPHAVGSSTACRLETCYGSARR